MPAARALLVAWMVALAFSSMSLSSQTVAPLTAGSTNTSYMYSFAASGISVPAGSQLLAQFDTGAFSISQVNGCQLSINGAAVAGASCSVNSASNAVVFSNVATVALTPTSISASFYSNGASYSGTSNILFYFQDSAGLQNTNSKVNTTVSIAAAAMGSCSATTASQMVGSATNFTFAYSPAVAIPTGSILQLVLPAWFGNGTNLLNNASANCSSNCSALLLSASESIVFKSIFSAAGAAIGTSQNVAVYSIKNPPSTAPIAIQILIQTSGGQNVQSCSVQLAATTPNQLRATFAPSNSAISANSIIKLSFRNTNPLPGSSSYLRIASPLALSYNYTAVNSTSTVAPIRVTSTDGSLLIQGLSTANIASLSGYFLGMFTLTNAPSSKKFTLAFTTQTYSSGTFYSVDSSSIDVQAVAATITVASVSAQNNLAYAIGQFTVSFTTINNLVSGSFAVIQFPSEMSIDPSSTCSTSVGSCFFSGNTVTANVQSPASGGSIISTVLSMVQNPLTTTASSTFSISTYYDASDSLVDQLTAGLTFTAAPAPLKWLQVTPSSRVVRDVSSYTISINFTNPVPAGVTLFLTFPTSIPISSVQYSAINSLSCIVSSSLQVVTLASCFSSTTTGTVSFTLSGIANPTSTKPTGTFNLTSFYSGLLLEYLSAAVAVAMTTPMAFGSISLTAANLTANAQTIYTISLSSLFAHTTGEVFMVTVPSELTLTTPDCTAVFGVGSLTCSVSGSILTVNLTGSSIGQLINFTVAGFLNNWYTSTSTILVQSATSDANQYLIESGSASISFQAGSMGSSIVSDNQIVLLGQSTIKLTVNAPFPLSKATNSTGLSVEVTVPATSLTSSPSGCTTNGTCTYNSSINGYKVTAITANSFPLLVTFSAQAGYFSTSDAFTIRINYQNQLVSTNINTTVSGYCTAPCQQCTLTRTTCSSCLPAAYTSNITLYRPSSTCLQTCPDGYYANTTTMSCELCNSNCTKCLALATNCSACSPTSNTYLYGNSCTDTCPSSFYKNVTTVACVQCPVGCSTCINSTYCLTCQALYLYSSGSCLSTCPNSSYVPVNGICTLCTSSCYTCSGTTSNCTGCNGTLILYGNACVTQCPSLTYLNGGNCYSCQSPCLQCTSNLLCTSCNSTMSLFDNRTCVTTCPSGYISQAQLCTACTSGCLTCSALASNCTSCTAGLYLYNGNTCVSTCPSPTQPNGNVCSSCVSPCVTCAGTAANCTSCSSTMYLLNNSCYACQSPCVSCTSSLICTSCNSSMSLFNSSTCVTTCPSGYISLAQVCTACSSACSTCAGVITNCTGCPNGKYLYNGNTCVSVCPLPTQPNGNLCSNCVSPCLTCSGTATSCTSCQTTMYLLNNGCYACQSPCLTCTSALVCTSCSSSMSMFNSSTCVSSCPSGYISLAQVCTACSPECSTCSGVIANCTSCPGSLYFYNNNTCVATCPSPTHPYGRICTLCISPCVTCTGTATNCTSCEGNMLLLNGSCYSQCPSGYYTSNQQCYSCGNCLACLSPTSCTTCNAGNFLLDGLCYSSCPPSSPILVGQSCVACSSQCFTCEAIPINCTSCSTSTFLLRYTCVSSCPLGMYTDRTTNKCLDSLSSRIVFFPLLIICAVLAALVLVSKCFAKNTAITTSLVACFAVPEVCVFIYFTVQLSQDQEGINTLLMIVLAIVGIVTMVATSVTFYVLNRRRIKEDPFLGEWLESPCNYYCYLICMNISLLNLKFYRIVYCRMFNSQALSLYLKFMKSIFPLTTIFTLLLLFASEIVVVVAAVLTLYNKNNKDQVFYTAVQCILVTAITALVSLIDLHKEDDFFSHSEYLVTKKYIEGTKDERKPQVEEVNIFDVPSIAIDSENCFGTGQKTFYNKQDSSGLLFVDSSNNKLDDQIEEDELSHNFEVQTQVGNRRAESSHYGSHRKRRVNIFEPIRQEEAEEDNQQPTIERFYKTDHETETNFEQAVRSALRREKSDVGQSPPHLFDITKDDIRSLAEPKELRRRWNEIIETRRQEARRLYRSPNKATLEMGETDKFELYHPDVQIPKGKRKKMKVTRSMKRTQEIYLQRLVVLEDKDRPGASTSLKKKRKRRNRKDSEEYNFP